MMRSRSDAPLIEGSMTGGTTEGAKVGSFAWAPEATAGLLLLEECDVPLETAFFASGCDDEPVVLPDTVRGLSAGKGSL